MTSRVVQGRWAKNYPLSHLKVNFSLQVLAENAWLPEAENRKRLPTAGGKNVLYVYQAY